MSRNKKSTRISRLALIFMLIMIAVSTTACFRDDYYRPEQRPYDPDMPRHNEEFEPRYEEPQHDEPRSGEMEPWEDEHMEPQAWEPGPMHNEPMEPQPWEPEPMPVEPIPGDENMTPEQQECWENNFDFEGSEGLESIPGWTPDQGPVNPSWYEGVDC